ncbi:hypothetical protein J437_LFUL014379 [Ladona fulva]|uniref:Uncharacterized protein n=1 Tax=Ladona fulva TaxID=123851 RepID=A0A8K0P609_LADFU|nr:hypothetical protein J437_LFUL014379 [Ladona fulva]
MNPFAVFFHILLQVNYSPNSKVSPYFRYISPEVILEVKEDDHTEKSFGAASSSGHHCGAESQVEQPLIVK